MGKKNYVKPVLKTEEFVPQEYCAVCEPECGDGLAHDQYVVFKDLNNNNTFNRIGDDYITIMTPCHDEDLDRDELPYSFTCKAQKYRGSYTKGEAVGRAFPVTCWFDPEEEHNYHIIAKGISASSKS